MKIITIEEHITDTPLDTAVRQYILQDAPYYNLTLGKELPYYPDFALYADMAEKRIRDMDQNGIDMQVLSCPAQIGMLPSAEAIPLAKAVNDRLAAAVRKYPDRFSAFAVLPWQDPIQATAELKRAVEELGLRGAFLAGRPERGTVFLDYPYLDGDGITKQEYRCSE